MARYIRDVILNKPDDFVSFMMNDFLQKHSFSMSDWKGEPAYRAGDPMFEGYKFLKWSYANGVFHLEAWLRGSFGGEWDLDGFVGIAMKKPYKGNLEQLIELLQQDIPQSANTQAVPSADGSAPAQPQNIVPVKTIDNPGSATAALVCGILTIVCCWSPLICIILGVITFSTSRTGKHSSKAGQAKAGKICAIVGLSIMAVLFILNAVLTGFMVAFS